MPLKVQCWNIEHLNMKIAQTKTASICAELAKADVTILLENKNLADEVGKTFRDHLNKNRLGIVWEVAKISAGGIKSASTAEFYQIIYKTVVDGNAVTFTEQTHLLVKAIQANSRMDNFFQVSIDDDDVVESSYRVPGLFDLKVGADTVRLAAFHAPGPGTQMAPTITNQALNVLGTPAIGTAFVIGDFNCYGGADPVPKFHPGIVLKTRTEKFVWTGNKRIGTTYRKKRGKRTRQRSSNPLDRVLVNRDANLSIEPTYNTNPLFFKVTDHIPIGAVVSFGAPPPPPPPDLQLQTRSPLGAPDQTHRASASGPDLQQIAALFNAGGTVTLCDRTLGTQGFDALVKASGLVVAEPVTSTITVTYSGPKVAPQGTRLTIERLTWPIPGFAATAASATFEIGPEGLSVTIDTGTNGPLVLARLFSEMADDPLGQVRFAQARLVFHFSAHPSPDIPIGLLFSGNFPLDLDGQAGWLKSIWGSSLPASVKVAGPIANTTIEGYQFLSVDLRADLPLSPAIALPHFRLGGQLRLVYSGLAAAAGAWIEDAALPGSGCYLDGALYRDAACLQHSRTLPATIPVTVLWIASNGEAAPDLYLVTVGDAVLPSLALSEVAALLLSDHWLAALPDEVRGWLAQVELEQLRIATAVTATEQQLYEAVVEVVMPDPIPLFSLDGITLSLEWLGMTVGTFQTVQDHQLAFSAAVMIGHQREFDLSLTFTDQEILIGGSYFDPAAGTADALTVRGIIAEFAGAASAALVPDELAACNADRLDALIAYRSRSFACEVYFSAELMGIRFAGIALRLSRNAAENGWSVEFGGVIDLASVLFEIAGTLTPGGDKALTIAWPPGGDAKGESLTLGNLLSDIGFGIALPDGLDFALTSAKFGYLFDLATGERALTLTAGVNFDGIAAEVQAIALSGQGAPRHVLVLDLPIPAKLDGLPVIGAMPNPVTLLQLIGASSDLSADLDEVNAALAALGSTIVLDSQALQAGLHLSIQLSGINAPVTIALDAAPPSTAVVPPASTAMPAAVIWKDVDRTLGPIFLHRIGLGWADGGVALVLDCAIIAGGISIAFQECGLTIPLADPGHVTFVLRGLGIEYSAPPIAIGGSFIALPGGDYDGAAVIQTPSLSLMALGGYRSVAGDMAMFVYGLLDAPPLGGPAFCYVTGVAAGFGYNRQLNIPALPDLAGFPLVAAADPTDPEAQKSFTDMAADLASVMPAAVGENWLAAGIRFTSFELVRSFALLTVSFGPSIEVALLGKSTIAVPDDAPLFHAAIVLSAAYSPNEGVLRADGMLTPDSYLISPDCVLSGGFALYAWFKDQPGGPDAGNFVLSIGGFAPGYAVPSGYPALAPLALNWRISDELTATGQGYAALTPSCVMAGGSLSILFQSGCLKAWFDAAISFYMGWKPYRYDLVAQVDIGVSLSFDVDLLFATVTVTLQADVGADLHIWGPDFTGDVRVEVAFISFTISFGHGQTQPAVIGWEDFVSSFLSSAGQPICAVRLVDGGLRQLAGTAGEPAAWVVEANRLVLSTHCLIPSSLETASGATGAAFGVRPVGIATTDQLASSHVVEIFRDGQPATDRFKIVPLIENVPQALWGDPAANGSDPQELLAGVLTGTTITAQVTSVPPDATPSIPIANLLVQRPGSTIAMICWSSNAPPVPAPDQAPATRWQAVAGIVAASARRDAILAELRTAGLDLPDHIALGRFGTEIREQLLDAPLLVTLSETRLAA